MTAIPAFGALPGERRGYAPGGGGQIHYREMGSGPAVLLIHQAPWASIQYRRILPLLAAAGYRAIAPDLPGHGSSDRVDPPTVEGFADALADLIGALGLDRVAAAGQHGGALVAARLAAAHPSLVSALILDNAPFYSTEERAARRGTTLSVELAADGGHFADRWALVRRIGDPGWSDETVHLSVLTYFANGPTGEDLHHAAPAYDFGPDVGRIACPVHLISGRADPLYLHAARLMERRSDWSCTEVEPGAAFLFDHPQEWSGEVVNALRAAKRAPAKKGS